ncbi:MAG TPA: acyl-CoA dehydratase activase [Desulfobacterales bacterium]
MNQSNKKFFLGTDVGSSWTKVVVIDETRVMRGYAAGRSGTDFAAAAERYRQQALAMANISAEKTARSVSTGYGRKNVAYADDHRTEISCHARGCFYYYPRALTIIDIGGQDNKIIKIDDRGRRLGFKMNRKCAAGTGAFLEEMAARLDLPLKEMNTLAQNSRDMVKIGSFCTVFSATEVLEFIRQGKPIDAIVKGIFHSMIQRVLEMESLSERVVMTGGVVAHNPYLVQMAEEMIGRPVLVPERPQLTGALGAALYAQTL